MKTYQEIIDITVDGFYNTFLKTNHLQLKGLENYLSLRQKIKILCTGLWGCLERHVQLSVYWREFGRKSICCLTPKEFCQKFNLLM